MLLRSKNIQIFGKISKWEKKNKISFCGCMTHLSTYGSLGGFAIKLFTLTDYIHIQTNIHTNIQTDYILFRRNLAKRENFSDDNLSLQFTDKDEGNKNSWVFGQINIGKITKLRSAVMNVTNNTIKCTYYGLRK